VNLQNPQHLESPRDAKRTKWIVERGSATIRIYLTPHGAKNYFTLSYWMDGKRKRQVFSTLQAAKDEAAIKATAITNGDLGAAKMSNADSAAYNRAIALLQPIGVPLEFAASEYASAVKRLGSVSMSQVVDFFLKRHPANLVPKMVKEVADEMIKLKRADQLSDRYVKQLEYDMNRFTSRFHCRLGDVSGTDVDAWLRELNVGPRTRNNLRNSVQALFNFGIDRKYLPKDHDEIDAVPLAKDKGGEIEIYTPAEINELLAVASPAHVPFLSGRAVESAGADQRCQLWRADESFWLQHHRRQQLGHRGGSLHQFQQSHLVASFHQHAQQVRWHQRHVLFQRSAVDELSRPLLPPPLALTGVALQ